MAHHGGIYCQPVEEGTRMDFEDKVAVLTASGQGIGRAIACALADAGAHIVIADINATAAQETADQVKARGRRALVVQTDVSSDSALRDLAQRTVTEFGRVDLLHNHAGLAVGGPIEDIPFTEWTRLFDFNVVSQIRGVTTFLPHLERSSGHIVNTTSSLALVAGHPLASLVAPYVTTKAAVIAWTQLLADYLRPRGVGVSVLAPDHTATGFDASGTFYGSRPADLVATAGDGVYERVQTPEEVAQVFVDGLRDNRFLLAATPDIDARLQHYAAVRIDPLGMHHFYGPPS